MVIATTQLLEIIGSHDAEELTVTTGVDWDSYEKLIQALADNSTYRISYLDGTLIILSPSRAHEAIKKRIAILLETYFIQQQISFYPLGSTTFRQQSKRGGKEPDESYCLGIEKDFPDLALEIITTSGGLESLAIYQRLEIPEVWFWQNNSLSIYVLSNNKYQQQSQSQLLPNLDLSLFVRCVQENDLRSAIAQLHHHIEL